MLVSAPADQAFAPDDELAARYGRGTSKRGPLVVALSAIAIVALAVLWFVWANPLTVKEFWKTVAYRAVDDRTVEVTWEVTLGPGERSRCAIAAENGASAIVGWTTVEVAGVATPTQQVSAQVRTTELAMTGLVYRCWLV